MNEIEIQTATAPYLAEYKALQAGLAGQKTAWVKKLRKAALNHFSEIGFPTARNEDWKYTRVTSIENQRLIAASMGLTQNAIAQNKDNLHTMIENNIGLSEHTLVFINGYYSQEYSQLGSLAKHITITNLASVLEQQPEMLKPYLGHYADYRTNGFAALNQAFMTDGAYLYIPENTILEKPIQLLFIATAAETAFTAYPRNLVIAGNNSQATIIENYSSILH